MLYKIDITNFGSFRNFNWKSEIKDSGGNASQFRKLNILYGRNYSGKTTLSRIIRSLENGKMPEKYTSPSFLVSTDSGTYDQTQIPVNTGDFRVYNKDFVNEHLAFLRDDDDEITPFAILGSENKVIEKEINEKVKVLGSVEEETGLRNNHAIKKQEYVKRQGTKNRAASGLKTKLTNKATNSPNGIKHNPIYKDPNYNTPKIEADIRVIKNKSLLPLAETKKKELESLLLEIPLPEIKTSFTFNSTIEVLYKTGNEFLTRKIAPTKPIQELLDDAILQEWVKKGIPQHRNKRETCGFCGQTLPSDLWDRLDQHFNRQSNELAAEIAEHLNFIETERGLLDGTNAVELKSTEFSGI